ncbi:hypothetical protein B0T18DRAFT_413310 [Schizothecium vesticola]|uniref:C2H2-type domain-containing protein n=1 Tax=Schizothecium vesticola TaxID=314040 RepID=A0AA40EX94_9PEZI|nr:hypothetical protein B0T18DRAFT_413310 [Schizothecium vesticola]
MDPVTPILALVATVCAIVSAVQAAQTLRDRHKKRKSEGTLAPGRDIKVIDITKGMFSLSVNVNYLVAKFGREFGTKSGGKILDEIFALRPDIQTLVADLKKLEHDLNAKGTRNINMDQRWESLAGEADALSDGIKKACKNALAQFVKTKGSNQVEEVECPSAMRPRRPLEFCYGALLCQSGKAKARDLSVTVKDDKTLGFVCGYCFLEVADYNAVRFSTNGQPVVYADLMAASHVVACASFADRRAHYKCLACFDNYLDVDLPSASALEKHMEQHPGFSFVKNESKVVQATNEKIRYWVLQPSIELQPFVDSGNGNTPETPSDEVSPLGTPEMAPKVVDDERGGDRPGPRRHPLAERSPVPAPADSSSPGVYNAGNSSPAQFPGTTNINTRPPTSAPPLPPPPPPRYTPKVEHELPVSKFMEDPVELPTCYARSEAVELAGSGPVMYYQQFNKFADVSAQSAESDRPRAAEQRFQKNQAYSGAQGYAMPASAFQQARDLDSSRWRDPDPGNGQVMPGSFDNPLMMEQGGRTRPPSRASVQSFQSERGPARGPQQQIPGQLPPLSSQPGQWDRQPHVERPYQAPHNQPQPAPQSTKTKKTGFMGIGGRK